MALGIGVVLGVLVFFKLFLHRPVFGETMMFLYYAYLLPLSRRIGRGFYEDGIWADTDVHPVQRGRRHQLAGRRARR